MSTNVFLSPASLKHTPTLDVPLKKLKHAIVYPESLGQSRYLVFAK